MANYFSISPSFSKSLLTVPSTDALIAQGSAQFSPQTAAAPPVAGVAKGAVKESAAQILQLISGNPLATSVGVAGVGKQLKLPSAPEVKGPAEQLGAKVVKSAIMPGTELAAPTLKKLGVPAIPAAIAGFAGDILTPLPFGKGEDAVKAEKALEAYASKISLIAPEKAPTTFGGKLSNLYTSVFDRFNPIVNVARKVETLPGENPEILARRYLGVKGISESKIFWKTTDLLPSGALKETGEGLAPILKDVEKNLDDFRVLLTAQRDVELAGRGIRGAGTADEATAAIDALKSKYGAGFTKLEDAATRVRDWTNRAILSPLREVGAISEEAYKKVTSSNQFYTPFYRVMDDLEGQGIVGRSRDVFNPKSVPVKKIAGSTKAIVDPLESLIRRVYQVTDFVERERVNKAITSLRALSPELASEMPQVSVKNILSIPKDVITSFENGKRVYYKVPQDLADAMKGMSESDTSLVMRIMSFPTKLLRAGATLTPEFIGRNPLRDQFSAFVFSKYGFTPGVDLVKGIFETVGKKETFNRWLAAGGDQSMFVSLDRLSNQKKLQEVLGKSITGKLGRVVKSPLDALQALSEFGEKGTRVGAFKKAAKKGASDIEAMFESRDITLDFARRGSKTKALNQMVAFFNANVQGIDKMTRSFAERPLQTSLRAVGGITVPSIALYLAQRNNPRYRELPEWRKELFWNIVTDIKTPLTPQGLILSIPKPFEVGIIFGTVPEKIFSWIDKNDPDALSSAGDAIMRGASPGYIPTALLPIIENISNYSFFRDRPIVGQSIQDLPPEMQANTYTSATAKEIGKLVKQSPAKIENLITGYGAGLANYALDISDKILTASGIAHEPPSPAREAADIPFIKAFVPREPVGSGSESVNRFYEILTQTRQAKAGVTKLAKEGRDAEAVSFLKSHSEAQYNAGMEKVASALADIRKNIDNVTKSTTIDPQQKRRVINALNQAMTEIARQSLIVVKAAHE